MTVVYAALFLSLGLLNMDFGRTWWRGQRLRLLVGVPVAFLYAYVAMPPLVFPQAIVLLLLTLIPNAIFTSMRSMRAMVVARRIVSLRPQAAWPPLVPLAVVLAWAGILALAPVVDASGLRDLADARESQALPPVADPTHVRIVPEESAIFAGSKTVGQLGTYYHVGTYTVQAEGKRLIWVAPLEFAGIVQWIARRTSPGIVVVDAENPDAQPELRQRAPMRYIPSARFNDNLARHVYFAYGTNDILELTLQVDDAGNPHYLATLGRPTIGWSGERVTGVVIIDPATGAMQKYDRAAFATLPQWVRRVVPPDLALAYNDWFGRYVHGFWNAQIGQRDVHLPARNDVYGLLVRDRFVWFVDHTSSSDRDTSMTGFTYLDSVTGALTYYTAAGGQFGSRAAESAVDSSSIVRQGRFHATQPLLYNIENHTTWVVPVIADNGKYQTLALVQAANGHVAIGNPNAGSPAADAFAAYRAIFADARTSGGVDAARAGTIDRIGMAGTRLFFTLRGDPRIYALAASDDPRTILARSGDRATFDAVPNDDGTYAVQHFRDRNFAP